MYRNFTRSEEVLRLPIFTKACLQSLVLSPQIFHFLPQRSQAFHHAQHVVARLRRHVHGQVLDALAAQLTDWPILAAEDLPVLKWLEIVFFVASKKTVAVEVEATTDHANFTSRSVMWATQCHTPFWIFWNGLYHPSKYNKIHKHMITYGVLGDG